MSVTVKLLYIVIDLILPLVLGYYFRRINWLSDEFCDKIIAINITVLCTVLTVLSFWILPLNLQLLWLPLFGILLSFIPGLTAYLISNKKYEAGPEKGSYLATAILSNIGMLGGLCTFFLYGEPGFAYIQIIALFQNLVFFLFCFPMAHYYSQLDKKEDGSRKMTVSSLFFNRNQLPVVGLAVGMALYLGDVPRPGIFDDMFSVLIHISAWMSLIPVGYSIRFAAMKDHYGRILDLIPIKFAVTPFVGYFIARYLFTDQVILGAILIAASVPTGINAVILARLYSLNLNIAGAAFFMTTAIFLFAVYPMLFFWLSMAH